MLLAGLLMAPAGAAGAKAHVARCALGRLPAALKTAVPKAMAGEEQRFAASIRGVSRPDRDRSRRAFSTGVAAYIYGMPPVLFRLTVARFPLNSLVGVGGLATPESRTVVAPNNDTAYSVSRIDLSSGQPVVLDAPATGGRYSVVQLLDAYTNAIGYVGASRAERARDQTVVLVPPGFSGPLPAGVPVLESPTRLVWLLTRTLVDGAADLGAATELMSRYSLIPLQAWVAGERRRATIISGPPKNPPAVVPGGPGFYDALGEALAADPPPPADGCALGAFASAGIGAGRKPSAEADPLLAQALGAAATAGARVVDKAVAAMQRDGKQNRGGWTFLPPDTARFGTDYAGRAVVADTGFAANTAEVALYPTTRVDRRGHPLSGRHKYVVLFRRRELPPARAFWSMTLYDSQLFLVDNPIDRYAVGDRTDGLRYGRGHSLKIYVQRKRPHGARAANWLPAPPGRFALYLRIYEPSRAAAKGEWDPPEVTRVR